MQKAIGELLLADYTRRGFVDGIGIRLPTICIRPGKPNKAASGFFSSILREPLVGQEAVLPVPQTVRHWHASPRSAVDFLVRASTLDGQEVGPRRTLSMLGLSAAVGEQIEALRRVAGEQAVRLIRRKPDESIMRIVETWAQPWRRRGRWAWALLPIALSMRSSECTSRMSWAALSEPGRDKSEATGRRRRSGRAKSAFPRERALACGGTRWE